MELGQNKHLKAKQSKEDYSSSEDDENAELLTEELEKGFLKVLSRLKKKDFNLNKESVDYFSLANTEGVKVPKKQIKKVGSQPKYKEWLAGKITLIEDSETKKELEALHDFWTNPGISKDEQFLRDYILNKKFLENDDSFNLEKELQNLSEEEEEVEKQAIFEEKYNCRFESPDTNFLQKYPETMKKASGKLKGHTSLTGSSKSETIAMESESTHKNLNVSLKSTINKGESRVGKKRKLSKTPDITPKFDVTDASDVSDHQQKKPKKPKLKFSVDNIAGKNPEEKQQVKGKFAKNGANLKKLGQMLQIKDNKLRKDKKQKFHKKQNIKQPVITKKGGNKVKDRERKPRHRVIKKMLMM